jgi:hypothetical protein
MSDPETIGQLKVRYDRLQDRAKYVGAGVAVTALFGIGDISGKLLERADRWLSALVVTLLLAAGGSLTLAYAGYRGLKRDVEKLEAEGQVDDDSAVPPCLTRPDFPGSMYLLGLLLIVVAAILIIVGVWWGALVTTNAPAK